MEFFFFRVLTGILIKSKAQNTTICHLVYKLNEKSVEQNENMFTIVQFLFISQIDFCINQIISLTFINKLKLNEINIDLLNARGFFLLSKKIKNN